jgi:virulence-associated protein VapD
MPIFKDNYFTNDSYLLRLSRLEILKKFMLEWAAPLSIPSPLVEWGNKAYDRWKEILEKVQEHKKSTGSIYTELKEAEEKTFKYYLKCKRLLISQFSNDLSKLKAYGIEGKFPRNRSEKIKSVEKLLRTNTKIIERGDSKILLENFAVQLRSLLEKSNLINKKILANKENGTEKKVTKQVEIFREDSKKLRTLYSWALMTWEPDEPYLVQLGFAVKPKISTHEKVKEEE